jgi:hypothetical protein
MGGRIGQRIGAGLGAALALAGAALGQGAGDAPVMDGDIALFLAESYAKLGNYDALFAPDRAHPDAAAIEAFARGLGVDARTASGYASLLVRAVRHREDCDAYPWGPDAGCPIEPDLEGAIRTWGLPEPSGGLLVAVARSVGPRIVETALEHPKAEHILATLYAEWWAFDFLAPLLAGADTPADVPAGVLRAGIGCTFYPFRGSEVLAVFDAAARRLSGDADLSAGHATTAASLIHQLLLRGLDAEALAVLDGLTDAERDLLLTPTSPVFLDADPPEKWETCQRAPGGSLPGGVAPARFVALNADLAAAFLAAGRDGDAAERIAALRALGADPGPAGRAQIALLEEISSPSLGPSEMFDMSVFGRSDEGPGRALWDGIAWPWLSTAQGSPAFASITADYLRARSQTGMAELVLSRAPSPDGPYYRHSTLPTWLLDRAPDLPALIEIYERALEQARGRRADELAAPPAAPRAPDDRPVPFVERELPAELRGAAQIAQAPPDVALPGLHPGVIRSERTGDDWIILYTSQSLDPVPDATAGLWVLRSDDGGAHWREPVYLGIRQHVPYAARSTSALPMLDGDHLRIEVSVDEADRAASAFPPAAVRVAHVADGLYLDFSWAALTRDRDRDGLTDIVEHRLGLSQSRKDTDGDGEPDGADSLPHVPYVRSEERFELGLLLIERMRGYGRRALIAGEPPAAVWAWGQPEPGEPPSVDKAFAAAMARPRAKIDPSTTVFFESEPRLYAGLRLPFRLVLLAPGEAARLAAEYGDVYTAGVHWILSDETTGRYYVEAGDPRRRRGSSGSGFLVRRTPDGYRIEELFSWSSG